MSLWLVEKTRHPSFECAGICSTHSIPVCVLIQLCSVLGQALNSNFSDAGIRGVLVVVETFYPGPGRVFSVVGGSEQASFQGESRTGKILAGLEDMLQQERRSRSSGQRLTQHPPLMRYPSTHWHRMLGFRALGSGVYCREASEEHGSSIALTIWQQMPLRSGLLGAGTPSSATFRTKFITHTLSNILPSWSGINCIDWGLGYDRGVPQT